MKGDLNDILNHEERDPRSMILLYCPTCNKDGDGSLLTPKCNQCQGSGIAYWCDGCRDYKP